MKKILVGISDSLLSIRIARVLNEQGYSSEFVSTPVRKDDLFRYELFIVHSSYPLTGLYAFLDNIMIHHEIPVIFISTNTISSSVNQFSKYSSFVAIDELKMDTLLPLSIQMFFKQQQRTKELEKENATYSKKIKLQEAMNKCKKMLMDQGLSEEESHQTILKYAMDHKMSKLAACEALLFQKE